MSIPIVLYGHWLKPLIALFSYLGYTLNSFMRGRRVFHFGFNSVLRDWGILRFSVELRPVHILMLLDWNNRFWGHFQVWFTVHHPHISPFPHFCTGELQLQFPWEFNDSNFMSCTNSTQLTSIMSIDGSTLDNLKFACHNPYDIVCYFCFLAELK